MQNDNATMGGMDHSSMDHTAMGHSASDMGGGMVIENNNAYVMAMGEGSRVEIHAADRDKTSWTQLSKQASKNSTSITVKESDGWEVGDRIAITSTSQNWTESEERKITKIEGNKIYFDEPLDFTHLSRTVYENNGQKGDEFREWEYEISAEVANLTRNVTIQGDADSVKDGFGGHTMIMDGASQHIDGAEFFRMGQEDILGRYPIHWHEMGDVDGQYIANVAVHHSFQKGITIHSTNNATVENTVIYDHVGHGLFLEDGDETGNHILGNLVFNTRESKTGLPIRTDKEHASSYWIENPNNTFIDNVAAGGESNGFWIMTTGGQLSNLVFKGNVGHSYTGDGGAGGTDKILGVDGQVKANTDFGQKTLQANFGVIEDFLSYGGPVWLNTHELVVKDSVFANVGRFFARHENVIQDTLFDGGKVVIYRDGGQQFQDVHLDRGTQFIVVGTDHANTQNAYNNLTQEGRAFPTIRYQTGHNDQQVFVDIDGSYTGKDDGTYFVVEHSDIGKFKAAPDAVLVNGLGWVTQTTIGVTEVTAKNAGGFRVVRSDGKRDPNVAPSKDNRTAGDDNADRSAANYEFNTATGMERDVAWLLDFKENPSTLTLNLTGVRKGDSAVYEIPGIVGNYKVTSGEQRVNSFEEMLEAKKTTYYRDTDSGSVFVRIVADKLEVQSDRRVDDLLAEFRARDSITMTITGDNDPVPYGGHTQLNQDLMDAIATQPAREVITQAEIMEAPKPLKKANYKLDRYESTSNTTDVTDEMPRWSNAETWDEQVPGANSIVVIGPGETVVLDKSAKVKGIIVNGGELIIEDDANLKINLSTDYLLVINGGLFQAGTEEDPIDTDFKLTLEGDDPDFDLMVSMILDGDVANTVQAVGNHAMGNMPTNQADDLTAAQGGETIDALLGDDMVMGSSGNDKLYGNGGADTLKGGAGQDLLKGQSSADVISGGSGSDVIYGGRGKDNLSGNRGNDIINGGDHNDTAKGGFGNDRIKGEDGNDTLFGGDGADVLQGNQGDDKLEGGNHADRLFGGRGRDALYGSDGNDVISGQNGNDAAHGGQGNDQISGGQGSDQLFGNRGRDTIDGGDNGDRIAGGYGADTLKGGHGNDTLDGNEGADLIYGGQHADRITGGDGADTLHGNRGNDKIIGGQSSDKLFGGFGNDALHGGHGKDTINGHEGSDTAYGGDHNDTIDGGLGSDRLYGQNGDDQIDGGHNSDRLFGGHGDDTLKGGHGNDTISGQNGDDVVYGGDHADVIQGGGGNDKLQGNSGDDKVWGGAHADTLFGGMGDDTLRGEHGNDVVKGHAGNDVLHGGLHGDKLYGGTGADKVNGGQGNDILSGGGKDQAMDIFLFGKNHGHDTIRDFEDGFDKMDISDFGLDRFADIKAIAKQKADGVALEFNQDSSIFLEDMTIAKLSSDDFLI